MKKKIIITLLIIFGFSKIFAQSDWNIEAVVAYQEQMNFNFADSLKSPLKDSDKRNFKTLDFYEINPEMVVTAKLIKFKKSKPFSMPTTTDRKPMYRKYGALHFELKGIPCVLEIYQNLDLIKMPKYQNYLFLPFTDLTSGIDSYGGGRYLDLQIPDGDTVLLDFNLSYNPYCAYNEKYSCPLVPKVNDLKVEVNAGVKNFHKP
jgi:uncharacterized protein (DUF1684 family)